MVKVVPFPVFTGHHDPASQFFKDAVDDRQTQARPFPTSLVVKKGSKIFSIFLGDARAIIGNLDHDFLILGKRNRSE